MAFRSVRRNPWAVEDASVFLKYCCPECNHQTKELHSFREHANNKHPLSRELFPFDDVDEKLPMPDIKMEEPSMDEANVEVTIKTETAEDNGNDLDDDIGDAIDNDDDDDYEPEGDLGDYGDFHEDELPTVKHDLQLNDRGWWTCEYCPETCFLFDFELREHMRTAHKEEIITDGCSIKNKEMMLERDNRMAQTNYTCYICTDGTNFKHKFELMTHWHDEHAAREYHYEACQWCIEFFEDINQEVSEFILPVDYVRGNVILFTIGVSTE